MKKGIRILIAFLIIAVGCSLIHSANDVLLRKSDNRYYMLEKELERRNETYDVQIYGSCHAYTSFNSMILVNGYDISCYNMSNPGEIIPATYLRMLERFKIDPPKVAVVEIWGVNAYETYSSSEDIFNHFFPLNVERIPFSKEKLEVISDFDSLSVINENFAAIKYKDRLLDFPLPEVEYNYSFSLCRETYEETIPWLYKEMDIRFGNNGFLGNDANHLPDYPQQQAKVAYDDLLPVEPDIVKYLDKIIELCEAYDVELLFYRAPYRSTANELRKLNWLRKYFDEKGAVFADMEDFVSFDYTTDFLDYEHLSLSGAQKLTERLISFVMEAVDAHDQKAN